MSSSGVVVGAQARLAGWAPVSRVSTWKGDPRWIPTARFHFHSCQTRYSGLLRNLSWLTSVGTTRNTVIRLGWSRIGLAVLILHAAGVGLIGRPAVISGRYNKCHSLQLKNHYAHFPPLQHTHIHAKTQLCGTGHGKWSWVSRHCMLAVAGRILCDRVKKPIGY